MKIIAILFLLCVASWVITELANIITSKRMDRKYGKYKIPETKKVEKTESFIPNSITCKVDCDEFVAVFEEGKVYWLTNYSPRSLIGYYTLEGSEWKVRCVLDKKEIASLKEDGPSVYITLNRCGDLQRYKENLKQVYSTEFATQCYNEAAKKTNLCWRSLEVISGIIYDIDTGEVVATVYSKDNIGAAAAFVCLHYDVIMSGKYHEFFSPIR